MRKAAAFLASSLSLLANCALAGTNGDPDRLLDASFDAALPLPTCPQ